MTVGSSSKVATSPRMGRITFNTFAVTIDKAKMDLFSSDAVVGKSYGIFHLLPMLCLLTRMCLALPIALIQLWAHGCYQNLRITANHDSLITETLGKISGVLTYNLPSFLPLGCQSLLMGNFRVLPDHSHSPNQLMWGNKVPVSKQMWSAFTMQKSFRLQNLSLHVDRC